MPSDLTLEGLHDALQGAMGWADSHLHAFLVDGGVEYGPPEPDWGTSAEDESRVRLARVLRAPKDRLVYQYDFGDDWQHVVVLEKVLPFDAERHRAPLVTGGRRACPPEDCGGVCGYDRMLDVLRDERDPEHEEMREWVGADFDPNDVDVEVANLFLRGA